MINRRIAFTINVDYRTSLEKAKSIPALLKAIVEEQKPVLFDRAHFAAYGDWAMKYEVVYLVLTDNFNTYMDIQQNINFRIREEFEKRDIFLVATPHNTFVIPPPIATEKSPTKPEREEKKRCPSRSSVLESHHIWSASHLLAFKSVINSSDNSLRYQGGSPPNLINQVLVNT